MVFLAYNFNSDTNHFLRSLGEIFNINFIPNFGTKNKADFTLWGSDVLNQRPANLKVYSQEMSSNFLMNGLVRLIYIVGIWVLFVVMIGQKRSGENNAKTDGVRFASTGVFKVYHLVANAFFRIHEIVFMQLFFAIGLQFDNPNFNEGVNSAAFIIAIITLLYYVIYLFFTFTRIKAAPGKDEPPFHLRDIDYYTSFIGD
jgi:hypothetical protein